MMAPLAEPGAATVEDVAVSLSWLAPAALSDAELARVLPWLTDEERIRHRAFVFERNQREYLATRGLVRRVLSRARMAPPGSWRFVKNEYGRPQLDPPCGLRFNLANHPSLVVCALREGELEVGVDVEPLARGGEVLEIASTVFSPHELAALRALPPAQQAERAISLWTLKEAYIKARGMGLSLPLQEFSFVFSAGGAEIQFSAALPDDPARWAFSWFDRRGHRIAVAHEVARGGRPAQVRCPDEPDAALLAGA
jgi:4'-phosphopantetheinyl transferase